MLARQRGSSTTGLVYSSLNRSMIRCLVLPSTWECQDCEPITFGEMFKREIWMPFLAISALSAEVDRVYRIEGQTRPVCFRMEIMRTLATANNNRSCRASRVSGVILLLFLTIGPAKTNCNAQNATASCQNSTVADAWGPEFTSEAKSFFTVLQGAIKAGDKKQFASLIKYPVHVYGKNEAYEIATPAEMVRRYSSIITTESQQAIVAQSPDCLFGNGEGVMAGGGRIWFQKQADGQMRIVTLNIILK